MRYKGIIVEESLRDNRLVNLLTVTGLRITEPDDPASRWHIYTVEVFEHEIINLGRELLPGPRYMHFWKDRRLIIVYRERQFEVDLDNADSRKPAIDYGLILGIRPEQLDFLIN